MDSINCLTDAASDSEGSSSSTPTHETSLLSASGEGLTDAASDSEGSSSSTPTRETSLLPASGEGLTDAASDSEGSSSSTPTRETPLLPASGEGLTDAGSDSEGSSSSTPIRETPLLPASGEGLTDAASDSEGSSSSTPTRETSLLPASGEGLTDAASDSEGSSSSTPTRETPLLPASGEGLTDAASDSEGPSSSTPTRETSLLPASGEATAVNIVLLGKTGTGKSATGNTILGRDMFRSESSFNSVTERSCIKTTQTREREVSVLDTPGFYDTKLSRKALAEELARSVYLSTPGPHAFLYVVSFNQRFTKQEAKAAELLLKVYGEDVLKYTIILFTHGDNAPVNLSEQIDGNKHLSAFIQLCGGRYHVFNNKDRENREQVAQLMEKIDEMVTQNEGGFYSSQLFRHASFFTWDEFWEKFKKYFQVAAKTVLVKYNPSQTVTKLDCAAAFQFRWAYSTVHES